MSPIVLIANNNKQNIANIVVKIETNFGTLSRCGKGANHFDCTISALGLARSVVMDDNPSNGDTLSGPCKIVNTIGNSGDSSITLTDGYSSRWSAGSCWRTNYSRNFLGQQWK